MNNPISEAFRLFIRELRHALETIRDVEEHDEVEPNAGSQLRLRARFDPSRQAPASPEEVLIGIGRAPDAQTDGVVLNNKGAPSRQRSWYRTVVELALDENGPEAERIAAFQPGSSDLDAILSGAVFVVEDVAPDTVLAVIAFLARRLGVPQQDFPTAWIDAARAWKRADFVEDPERSWPALVSALGHSYLGRGAPIASTNIAPALLGTLSLTADLLYAQIDPENVPPLRDNDWLERAHAFIALERRDYEISLAQATRLELSAPVAGAPGQHAMVDAYFATEIYPSGLRKLFVRSDETSSFFGKGYALMGLHRPDSALTGNDMVVSTDPRFGLSLEALWDELERLEWDKWGDSRPKDNPRGGVSKTDSGAARASDQPWWDNKGKFDLIAAPKGVRIGGVDVHGSKLRWRDVLEAAWRCFSPLSGLHVACGDETGLPLHKARPARETAGPLGKRLFILEWDAAATAPETRSAFTITPTVERAFAALVTRSQFRRGEEISLADLPDRDSFIRVEISGGFALIHERGVVVFRDWRLTTFNKEAVLDAFDAAWRTLETSILQATRVNDIVSNSKNPKGFRLTRDMQLALEDLHKVKETLHRAQMELDHPPVDREAARLRAVMTETWGAPGHLEKVLQQADAASTQLESEGAISQRIGLNWLTRYGLPLGIAGTIAPIISDAISPPTYSTSDSSWMGIGVYALSVLALFLITHLFLFRRR